MPSVGIGASHFSPAQGGGEIELGILQLRSFRMLTLRWVQDPQAIYRRVLE